MGIFARLFNRSTPETRATDSLVPDIMGGLYMLGSFGTVDAGVTVTPETAMQAAAVYACVSRIARDIATLPRHVIDRDNGGRVKGHPVGRVLRTPNQYMTGASFWESYGYNLLLYGNGYAAVERDDAVNPSAMLPLMARNTNPRRAAGELFYQVGLAGGRPLPAMDVVHTPLLAPDGICGRSPISTSSKTIGTSIALADFAARYFSQGSHLNDNAFELPPMSPEALKETHRLLQERYAGLDNAHQLLAMPGLKVHSLRHSMHDNQAIEARDFQLREVCRLYGMPVGIIDPEKSKYAGLEAQYADYSQSCLRPLVVKIEEELNRKLFTEEDQDRYAVRFNLDAVIRASLADRMEADAKGVNAAILTPNEARAHHDLPPVEGGDTLRINMSMGPVSDEKRNNPENRNNPNDPANLKNTDAQDRTAALVNSIAAGIAVKEAKAVRSAARKGDSFRAWADEWFAEHRAHLMERLPIIDDAQADTMIAEARRAVLDAHAAGTLDTLLDRWSQERPTAISRISLN